MQVPGPTRQSHSNEREAERVEREAERVEREGEGVEREGERVEREGERGERVEREEERGEREGEGLENMRDQEVTYNYNYTECPLSAHNCLISMQHVIYVHRQRDLVYIFAAFSTAGWANVF